jgi:uncharacterized delta-60 repeat protein
MFLGASFPVRALKLRHVVNTVAAAALAATVATSATANGPASPDGSFGYRGLVITANGGDANLPSGPARAIAEDSMGRLVTAGGDTEGFVIARYLEDGQLDESFSGDGRIDIADFFPREPSPTEAQATEVAVRPDGTIVAVGDWHVRSSSPSRPYSRQCWAIAQVLPDGRLDPAFGDGTGRRIDCGAFAAYALTLQRDGRVLVGGRASRNGPLGFSAGVIVRYNRDGSRDKSFGSSGTGAVRFIPPLRENAGVLGLMALPSGKILASGYFRSGFMLSRLNADGSLDRTLGNGEHAGRVVTNVSKNCERCAIGWGLARDSKNRILVTGYAGRQSKIVLIRYLPSGRLDASFGEGGVVRTRIGSSAISRHVAVQGNGRIVVAARSGQDPTTKYVVVRYMPNGGLDRSFFGDGVLQRAFGDTSGAQDVLVDSSGRLVISGGSVFRGQRRSLLARYLISP